MQDFFGVAPWVLVTALMTWAGQAFIYRKEWRKMELDHAATVDASRDDLAIELLSNARNEVVQARSEMTALREEINSLRAMEQQLVTLQESRQKVQAERPRQPSRMKPLVKRRTLR